MENITREIIIRKSVLHQVYTEQAYPLLQGPSNVAPQYQGPSFPRFLSSEMDNPYSYLELPANAEQGADNLKMLYQEFEYHSGAPMSVTDSTVSVNASGVSRVESRHRADTLINTLRNELTIVFPLILDKAGVPGAGGGKVAVVWPYDVGETAADRQASVIAKKAARIITLDESREMSHLPPLDEVSDGETLRQPESDESEQDNNEESE